MSTMLLRAGPLQADFASGGTRPTFGRRNSHPIAKFPQGVDSEFFFTMNMPESFAVDDLSVVILWAALAAVVGDVEWEVSFERNESGVDNISADSFAAGKSSSSTTAGTAGILNTTTVTFAAGEYDSVQQGEQFRIRVRRLGSGVPDTMLDEAQVTTLSLTQTATPIGGGGGGGGGFWTDGAGTRAGIGKGVPAPLAAGSESLAHGSNATAAGANSLALGDAANAGFADTLALMRSSIARATDGIAIGRGADAGAANDIAIGRGSFTHTVLSTNGIAIGYGARSESPDHIRIGRGGAASTLHLSNDLIAIGRNVVNTLFDADRGIAIGTNVLVNGRYQIAIGGEINAGGVSGNASSNIIMVPRYFLTSSNVPDDLGGYNLILSTPSHSFAPLDNRTGVTHGGNLILLSGDSQAGLRSYGAGGVGNVTYNTLIGNQSTFIYSESTRNAVIGAYANQLGDFNNGTQYNQYNLLVGNRNYCASFSTGDSLRNTAVGFENRIQGNTNNYGQTAIGNENYCYSGVNFVYGGTVAIGTGNRVSNRANVGIGYKNYLYKVTTQAYNTFRGNFAVGDFCKSYPLSDVPWRSTMAQGIRARAWVGGHRTFSADDNIATTKPNQSGFVTTHVETTDATQTVVLTFPTEADKAYSIWGFAVARRTDVDGFNAVFGLTNTLVYRNLAGAPVLVGAPKAWTQDANQGAPAWTMDITIVANDIVARVTGTAAQTVEWLPEIHILEVRG